MKKLKHLFTILLTILCITNVSYAASLDYGLYNVKNDVYHEQEIGMNMARTYLNQTMRVDAKTDGTYYYTVEFSGTEYMNKHRILVNGSQVSTTKKSNSSNGTVKLTFKVKSLSSKIKAKLYVDAMGRDVEFQIIPDFNTAQCVKKYSKKENTKTDKTDKTNKTDKKENTKSDSKKEQSKKEESKKEESKKESIKSDKTDKTTKTEKVDSNKDSKKDSDKEKEEKTESKTEESKEDTKEEKVEETVEKEEADSNDSENTEEVEEKEDKTEEKTETEKVSAENTDEKKSSKMPLIIGGVAVLAVIGAVVVFTKKRK